MSLGFCRSTARRRSHASARVVPRLSFAGHNLAEMGRYRHWKNYAQAGETAFITTTALDFAHIFDTNAAKDQMVRRLFSDHDHYGAILHAFVVMSNHIHFLARLPQDRDVSWFVQRVKSNSAREIMNWLPPCHEVRSSVQSGLNRRKLRQAGFRSVPIKDEAMFWQKVDYIHLNPVRAGLVQSAEAYPWSSAKLFEGRRLVRRARSADLKASARRVPRHENVPDVCLPSRIVTTRMQGPGGN